MAGVCALAPWICCSWPVHCEDSSDALDVLLLGSVQGQLHHQLLLRYQL